jgi:hypothetical protein
VNITGLSEQLVAWFKNQGAELLHAGKDASKAQAFKAGESYLGKVQETLPNGRSLVQVGQTRLDMALPREIRAGDTVRLVYVTSGPRPTFQLAQSPVAALAPVRLSDTAHQVNALLRLSQGSPVQTAPAPSGSPQATGPQGATPAPSGPAPAAPAAPGAAQARPIVANVAVFNASSATPPLTSAMTGGAANPSMALVGQAVDGTRGSLASHASLMTQGIVGEERQGNYLLPMRLRQVLTESGLFYESHLSRWTQGRMTLEAIQREPQARLAEHSGRILDLPGLEGMPEEAARLAGRQLQMLEGASFYWQGLAWPNQRLDWQVEEDPRDERDHDESADWRTRLRLELPRLGDIAAEMSLGADGLKIRIMARRDDALQEVRTALPALIERLRLAGLDLAGIEAGLADGEPGTAA